VAFGAALLCGGGLKGQQSDPRESIVASPGEQKLRDTLNQVSHLEFVETPLRDVVQFLREHHDIPIELDYKELDNDGLSTDVPVTRNLKGVSLRSALRLILRDLDLTYVFDNEVLTITSREAAARRPAIRSYVVAHLVPLGAADADELAELLREMLHPRPLGYGYAAGQGTSAAAGAPGSSGYGAAPAMPTSVNWSIAAYGPLLVVRDTEEGHDQLVKLLNDMAEKLSVAMPGAAAAVSPGGSSPMGPSPTGGSNP
jgi:type II secretory pathway component GspD/PulD (secretin)